MNSAANAFSHAVDVVAAIVEVDGRFLLTRRPQGVHLEGCWEFPGGKVHAGETHAEALARELREELDVHATVGALVLETTHAYPEQTVALHFYACVVTGTPTPIEGQEMRWVPRGELRALELPAADAALIEVLTERH